MLIAIFTENVGLSQKSRLLENFTVEHAVDIILNISSPESFITNFFVHRPHNPKILF